MAIGGAFNLQGHKNSITTERNTYISMYSEGTHRNASYINVYDGNNATGIDQNTNTSERVTNDGDLKCHNGEFAQGDSLGKRILDEILGLDGNKDNLTVADLKAVNQSWLNKMFGKEGAHVKLNSKFDDKSGILDICYKVGDFIRHLYINIQTENESKKEQNSQLTEFSAGRRNDIKKGQEKLYQEKLNAMFGNKYSVNTEVGTMVKAPKSLKITINQSITLEELRNDLKCDEKVIINNNPSLKSKKVQVGGFIRKDYSYDKIQVPAGTVIEIPTEQIFKNEKPEWAI